MRSLTSPINRPAWVPLRGRDFTATVCLAFSTTFSFFFEFPLLVWNFIHFILKTLKHINLSYFLVKCHIIVSIDTPLHIGDVPLTGKALIDGVSNVCPIQINIRRYKKLLDVFKIWWGNMSQVVLIERTTRCHLLVRHHPPTFFYRWRWLPPLLTVSTPITQHRRQVM
jgi:hypothetical protein